MANPAWVLCFACSLAVAGGLRIGDVESEDFGDGEADDPGSDANDAKGWALDWAVSEVIQELHPLNASLPCAPGPAASDDVSLAADRSDDTRWHYGAHHKAGTNLLRSLAITHLEVMKQPSYCLSHGKYGFEPKLCKENGTAKVWFWCNLSTKVLSRIEGQQKYLRGDYHAVGRREAVTPQPTGRFRGVHIVRDPLSMVVSGYIYHMENDDTPPGMIVLRNMTTEDGVAREAEFVKFMHGKEMVATYSAAPPWLLQVHFESFTQSSESFDKTSRAIFNHMLKGFSSWKLRNEMVRRARQQDLRRYPPTDPLHVADNQMKKRIREVLDAIPKPLLDELKSMRKALGYES